MSQRIWIVRHGNREDFQNPGWSRTAQRPFDPALSTDGETQAREVGLSLQSEQVHRVFASPFLRTIQTASHIADALNLPVCLEPGIGEILPNVESTPALLPEVERKQRFPRIDEDYTALKRAFLPGVFGRGPRTGRGRSPGADRPFSRKEPAHGYPRRPGRRHLSAV